METTDQQPKFKGLRKIFFPIETYELKKALPMSIIFFFVLFNYTCVRNIKDSLIVTAPNSGAEVLSFLKLYLVMPSAVLFMLVYAKASDILSNEKLFYATLSPFILFFGAFGFLIYPNLDILHPAASTVAAWQANYSKAFYWPLAIVGNWSFALFFILAELWGSTILSLSFWQFANQICKMSEAKRFYAFFGLVGQFALIFVGTVGEYFSKVPENLPAGVDPWGVSLRWLMGMVFVAGVLTMCIYRWIYTNVLTDKRFYDKSELPGVSRKKKSNVGFWQSLKIMITSPYLGLIAALIICYGTSINLIEALWKGQAKILYPNTNDFNIFMSRYVTYTGIVSLIIVVIGGNLLRMLKWVTAAMVTPALIFLGGSLFFAFILFRDRFVNVLESIGSNPVSCAVVLGMSIIILLKSTKYALFDWTKEMAYIPLDEEMKVKGKVIVDVVGGRVGKAGGALMQSTLMVVIGFFSASAVKLIDIAPYLSAIFLVVCGLWMFAVKCLGKKIEAITAVQQSTPVQQK
ncbi:MAG: NTP/NDP exchange transporter [Puniceicoccales bacterium]|jgi:AAA family ATP:ADP antiporter|nr:NTP/NDP exchange transporter [Puniceicoccales bacterium]